MLAEPVKPDVKQTPKQKSSNERVMPKLKIGKPGDRFEQEADRVADSVMRMPERPLQMQPMEDEEEIQMQPMEEEEKLQMVPVDTGKNKSVASHSVSQKIARSKGSGKSLPTEVNSEMSQKMGHNFSDVSIHSDREASALNREVGSRAFTYGKDIYFNSGEFKPGTSEGKHLLAHELTHVLQQDGGKNKSSLKSNERVLQRYPEPESPNFWENLRRDAVMYANNLVSNNDRAINQLARDLSGQDNASPSGAVAIDLMDFSMDVANASPASKLGFKLLQRIYDQAMQVRSGTLEFASFSRTVADATQTLQNSIPNDWSEVNESSPDVFKELQNLMENESETNRNTTRNEAIQLLRDANSNIPGYRTIMQKLVQAWIGGAADQTLRELTIDLPDPDGFSSGYLRIYANIRVDTNLNYLSHNFTALSLDDVDLPTGTKEALKTAWGEDFYLDELPFPCVIHLTMGRTIVILQKESRESTNDLNGWDSRVINVNDRFAELTIENRKEIYFEHIRPRIEHLQSD